MRGVRGGRLLDPPQPLAAVPQVDHRRDAQRSGLRESLFDLLSNVHVGVDQAREERASPAVDGGGVTAGAARRALAADDARDSSLHHDDGTMFQHPLAVEDLDVADGEGGGWSRRVGRCCGSDRVVAAGHRHGDERTEASGRQGEEAAVQGSSDLGSSGEERSSRRSRSLFPPSSGFAGRGLDPQHLSGPGGTSPSCLTGA